LCKAARTAYLTSPPWVIIIAYIAVSIRDSSSLRWSTIMIPCKAENCPVRQRVLAAILGIGLFLGGESAGYAADGAVRSPAQVDLPADLDLVPRDAAGFVHIRAADLWRGEWAKDIRYLVDRAGPEAWKAFEKKCPVDPSTLERITVILPTAQAATNPFPGVDPEAVSALVVVTTNKPYDRLALIQALGPREKVYGPNLYYFNEELWSGLVIVDERTFLIGSEDALVRFFELSRRKDRSGPLRAPLSEAARKHQVVVGLNPTLLGKEKDASSLPGHVQKLLAAQSATLTLDLDQGIRLDVRLDYRNEGQAEEGEKALRDTLELARQGLAMPIQELERVLHDPDKASTTDLPENFAALVGLGFLRELDTLLKEAPIERRGPSVKLAWTYRKLESAQLLFVASFGTYAVARSASATWAFGMDKPAGISGKDPIEEHLKNLAQALDKYHAKHGTYPPPALYDREGRPVLSWRVALLPYLGEEALYNQFKLDEPWDSLHNKRLLKKLPQSLRSPNYRGWGAARWKTTTQVFTGANTVFEGPKGVHKADVAKQAILLAHLMDDNAVYWTKPADLSYAADQALPRLFGKTGRDFQVLLADGGYRTIDKSMEEKTLRALIERSGGKPSK
jgi:hypothetical protein